MLFAFLFSLFGATFDYCNICAWPYVATVNYRNQCVIGWSKQSDLDNTCVNWCLLRASDRGWFKRAQTADNAYALIIPSKSPSGSCVCAGYTENDVFEQAVRPQNSCPSNVLGPSNDEIINWMNTPSGSQYGQSSSTDALYQKQAPSATMPWMSSATMPQWYYTPSGLNYVPGVPIDLSNSGLAMASGLADVNRDIKDRVDKLAAKMDAGFDSVISPLSRVGDSLATTLAVARNAASGDQLSQVQDNLMYAINSRSGGSGSSDVDLTGVTDAINASNRSILDSLGKVAARSQGSDSGDGDAVDLSGVNSRLDKVNKNTLWTTQAVDSFNSSFGDYAKRQDSRYSSDSSYGSYVYDSLKRNGFGIGGLSSDSTSWFNNQSSQASTNQTAVNEELTGMAADIKSSSCVDFPSLKTDVPFLNIVIDLGSEINRYPFLLVIMRMLGRLMGGISGFMLVFRAIQSSNTSMNG